MDLAFDIEEVESRVRSLAPLVKRIAKHIAASMPGSVDQGRLVQAGMAGLLEAARRYHGGPGPDFDSYAVPRIRREIIDSLQGSPTVAVDVRRRMRDAEAMIAMLERQKGRPPTDAEVAKALRIGIDEYRDLLREAHGHQIVYHDDAAAEAEDPLSLLEDPKLRDTVIKAIDALPERERLVMSLYHEHRLNHAEIGAVLGLSEPQVSEMYTQAIARIRAALWKR
ncbi:MAG TPA: sigma-70 family RNA polymerase sigma factor [Burkholderiales bacterium]|nr:sigma-70 family RNA polymerase sigma factor [Burkholderiales bacterium]